MPRLELRAIAGAAAVTVLLTAACAARPVTVPFDFSRGEIGLEVRVHGAPLYMFLDTGASPSAIDTARARAAGLKIDFAHRGEASGSGSAVHVYVYPAPIDGLVVGGRRFGPIAALAADQTAISHAYGRAVGGTLGLSFLAGHVVVIDYPARRLTVGDSRAEVAAQIATCRRAWQMPLKSFKGDFIPIVDLRIGSALMPAGIDTGSDSAVDLFQNALKEPAVKAALTVAGTHRITGNRGESVATIYRVNAPVALGPFAVPAGARAAVNGNPGSIDTRLANAGNPLLAAMRLKLLLDYRDRRIGFFGDCAR
ncbi:MAG TPA: aspartyl protease family protein [Rhizomicrobium sp.]|nr:aspartyl protease family protein [Rhizomicrobium sp.]